MTTTRKFFTVAFAVTALTVGALATMNPANATWYCHWTPRGTVCTQ